MWVEYQAEPRENQAKNKEHTHTQHTNTHTHTHTPPKTNERTNKQSNKHKQTNNKQANKQAAKLMFCLSSGDSVFCCCLFLQYLHPLAHVMLKLSVSLLTHCACVSFDSGLVIFHAQDPSLAGFLKAILQFGAENREKEQTTTQITLVHSSTTGLPLGQQFLFVFCWFLKVFWVDNHTKPRKKQQSKIAHPMLPEPGPLELFFPLFSRGF